MGFDFDAAEVKQHLDDLMDNVGVQAQVDQHATALDRLRDNGTWWAALAMLGMERNNVVATAIATQNLKRYLHDQDHEQLTILAAYLLHNTINLVANQYEDGDITAAIEGIVSEEDFVNFEKFVETSGKSCANCGFDDGWTEHVCPVAPDDSIEG